MDTPDVYPDVLGDALSFSSQRAAQLGSLVTTGATVEAQRRARATAARAARDKRALSALRDQERAAWQRARAGWAPAHDARWLAQADLPQAARVWSAAAAYADADPTAAAARRKCEERLRALHPYAMAWYDRLRSEGAGAFDAMRQALPLFARAPHTRPGDPATQHRALEFHTASRDDDAADGVQQPGAGNGLDSKVELMADMARARASGDRTAAQLAAESFPCTAADAMTEAASRSPVRGIAVQNVRKRGHSV
jgi:hypothetical protein